jgi:hypothetical protein
MEQELLYASQRKVAELVEKHSGQRVIFPAPSEALPH